MPDASMQEILVIWSGLQGEYRDGVCWLPGPKEDGENHSLSLDAQSATFKIYK